MGDTDPTVREASFEAVGTAMKVVSEKNISTFLVDVDNLKMAKVSRGSSLHLMLSQVCPLSKFLSSSSLYLLASLLYFSQAYVSLSLALINRLYKCREFTHYVKCITP